MAKCEFRYEVIKDAVTRRHAQAQAKEIRQLLVRTSETVVEIGKRLAEVKQSLSPAMFRAWLECEFCWKAPNAFQYMQAAKVFGELDCLRQFQPSALVALARKHIPEAVVQQAIDRARAGETITWKITQQLLAENCVPSARRDGGKPRKGDDQRTKPAVLAADPVDTLRQTLDAFTLNLDAIAVKLTRTDRDALADRFLHLAVQLRQPVAAPAAVASKTAPKRRRAALATA